MTTTATIAVKGSASDDVPADYAIAHFGYEFNAPARSEALAGGNAVIDQLRATVAHIGVGVREMKVQSFRVEETFNHVGPDHVREHTGWVAQIGGQIQVESDSVPAAIAELIKTGVRTHQLTWHLDKDRQLQAHRAVRREAVADAREAANDFALALGADLGRLITLADPGLLGSAAFASGPITRAASMASAVSRSSDASWDQFVDVDPAMITISANVEASYEVSLP
jgi:uncharacterized protein YggE